MISAIKLFKTKFTQPGRTAVNQFLGSFKNWKSESES